MPCVLRMATKLGSNSIRGNIFISSASWNCDKRFRKVYENSSSSTHVRIFQWTCRADTFGSACIPSGSFSRNPIRQLHISSTSSTGVSNLNEDNVPKCPIKVNVFNEGKWIRFLSEMMRSSLWSVLLPTGSSLPTGIRSVRDCNILQLDITLRSSNLSATVSNSMREPGDPVKQDRGIAPEFKRLIFVNPGIEYSFFLLQFVDT